MPATEKFYVQLSLKDYEKFKRELASGGPAAQRMAATMERAIQKPNAALKGLDGAARQAVGGLRSLATQAGPLGGVLQGIGPGGLAAAAGIGAITAALHAGIRAARQSIDTFDKLDDSAQRAGLSAGAFQELSFAFGQVGVAADKTEQLLVKFSKSVGDVALRGAEAPKELRIAFAALGLGVEDVQAKANDLPGLLRLVSDGLAKLDTQAAQTAAAQALFGRSAAEILPLLSQGSDAINRYTQMAHDLGAVLDNETVQALSTAGDRLAELEQRWDVQVAKLTAGMVPAIVDTKEGVVELLTSLNELLGTLPEAEKFWREFSEMAFEPLGPLKAVAEWLGIIRDRSFYANRPGAAGELLAERQAAAGAYGPQLPPPAQDRGLVIEINEPNSVTPGRPPIKPYDIAEWRRQLDAFNAPIEDKTARKTSALNAPIPKPRPLPYSYADADPLSYGTAGALGGGFDQMPKFELGEYDKFWLEFDQKGKETYDNLTMYDDAFRNAALTTAGTISSTFGDALVELRQTGKVSTEALIESFASMIIKQLTALAVQLALNAAMAAMTGGASTAGGGVGALVGIGAGLAFGAGGAGSGGQYNQSSQSGTAPVFAFHGGGVAGFGSPALRYVHPAVFDAVPRLHNGGFAGNEVPAVLTRGEGVFTPEQMKAMGSPNFEVHIHDHAGVDVRTSQDENGNLQVDIMKLVDSAMTANASRPNSQFSQYMNSRNRVIPR